MYFPACDHRTIKEIPTKGKYSLVEGPTAARKGMRVPLGASGGLTEVDFNESINISSELTTRSPKTSPHSTSFHKQSISPDSSPPYSSSPTSPPYASSPDAEEPILKRQPLELLRPPQLLLFLEKMCLLVICIASTLVCFLVMIGNHTTL